MNRDGQVSHHHADEALPSPADTCIELATVLPAPSIARDEAVRLVQQIMDGDYANDGEAARWLERLDRGFGCPSGYVSDLIFVHIAEEPTAAQVVDRAMAYRPIAL